MPLPSPHYTMKRQLDDYYDKFYNKEAARFKKLAADDNKLAKDIALWKETVAERWDNINVVSKSGLDEGAETGKKYKVSYTINEQGLDNAIGLELVALKPETDPSDRKVYKVYPFKMVKHQGNDYTFEATIDPDRAGNFRLGVRMFPQNKFLPHRQDFCYVKWLD